ncbi:MAG TPA: GNAT family N-acetyltransferase [Gaiellaceae bacterium]|jgi:ribosomal protein S18 acetylase RimI-like enzyme|nr:GNAT family N-acetyltransferase [Gaiellaceae bacterium]
MKSDFERAAAFEDSLRDACIERVVPSRFGTALLTDTLPRVWSVNLLRVETADAEADELIAEAERLLGEAGLNHRRLLITDAELGRRLEDPLTAAGWKTDHFVFMVSRRDPSRQANIAHVVEVESDALTALRRTILAEWLPDLEQEAARQIMEAERRYGQAGRARYFAVVVDGVVVSSTNLYSDGRTAQIEDVATLPQHRGRGYASAVVLRALDEARAAGHDFVFLVADARDWPKELYGRLGFDPVGERFVYRLTEVTAEQRPATDAG